VGEESLADVDRLERTHFFDARQYENQRNVSFGFSMALAPRVSLGIAGEGFIRDRKSKMLSMMGYRYGLILMPRRNVSVGFCYFHFPDLYRMDRFEVERLADESLNIGISYSPWPVVTIALDVRNVSNEGNGAEREPHIGVEVFPLKYLSLRGGFYQARENHDQTYSFGFGLFDGSMMSSDNGESARFHVGLGATLIWQKERMNNRWFILSCIIRI
jgi:hypothetical protein